MAPRLINHCENGYYVEQKNIIEMQCAGVAKQAEEQKKKNREIILKLMRSVYCYKVFCHFSMSPTGISTPNNSSRLSSSTVYIISILQLSVLVVDLPIES